MTQVFIKIKSHRAREKLMALLGYTPKGYYVPGDGNDYRQIPLADVEGALRIKGISKTRQNKEFLQYWY